MKKFTLLAIAATTYYAQAEELKRLSVPHAIDQHIDAALATLWQLKSIGTCNIKINKIPKVVTDAARSGSGPKIDHGPGIKFSVTPLGQEEITIKIPWYSVVPGSHEEEFTGFSAEELYRENLRLHLRGEGGLQLTALSHHQKYLTFDLQLTATESGLKLNHQELCLGKTNISKEQHEEYFAQAINSFLFYSEANDPKCSESRWQVIQGQLDVQIGHKHFSEPIENMEIFYKNRTATLYAKHSPSSLRAQFGTSGLPLVWTAIVEQRRINCRDNNLTHNFQFDYWYGMKKLL